jgi:hypothetical protein
MSVSLAQAARVDSQFAHNYNRVKDNRDYDS